MRGAHTEVLDCFGGRCSVTIEGDGARGAAPDAARWAAEQLRGCIGSSRGSCRTANSAV